MRSAAGLLFVLLASGAQAQTLLDETSTIVAPTAPGAVLREFEITSSGNYELTLTDFGVPAALGSERSAILRDGVIVKLLSLDAQSSATTNFDATPGTYALSIVATPGASGIGTIGARIRRGTETPVLELSETFANPNPPAPVTRQTLDTSFSVVDAGQYRVTLSDLGFPGSLASARLSVVPEGGAPAAILNSPGNVSFTASPGNHRLFVIADAGASTGSGVFYAEVRNVATGTAIYRNMVPVGPVAELGGGQLTAGTHTLQATDLSLPTPLSSLKLAVTSQGALVSRLDAPGSTDFMATAGGHEVLAVASPVSGASGSYAVDLRRGANPALSFVNTASDGSARGASTFVGVVTAPGVYRLRLTDFAFPQGFTMLRAVITQNGANVASLAAPGTVDATLVSGAVRVLVFGEVASTSSGDGNGLFGVELRPTSGTDAAVIEATRGIGTAFGAWLFSVNGAGRYQIIADDLEFPARFAAFDAVVTRGPEVIGSFFGGGSFIFSATPGTYFVNFIARPGTASGGAGTFRVRVATAPALPSVTLTSTAARVNAGGTAQLQWSSTNATQCTASGAWSGTKPATGSETTAALSTQSTFGLECTGPGGTSNAQVVVDVNAPNQGGGGGGGGGGRLSEALLLALLAAAAMRARRKRGHSSF